MYFDVCEIYSFGPVCFIKIYVKTHLQEENSNLGIVGRSFFVFLSISNVLSHFGSFDVHII